MRRFAVVAGAALAFAAPADASVGIAFVDPASALLRVDARGNAEVSWVAGGSRRYVLVPPQGRLLPGGRLSAPDVSRPAPGVVLPYRKALRRTPDGRLWALQAWQTGFRGPVELRFSRWRGEPTKLTAELTHKGRQTLLVGRATFQGRPVYGTSPTPEGNRIPLAAAIDCFACSLAGGQRWFRVTGVRTRADGRFGATLARSWLGTKYRATIAGPNIGTTYAPDAAAIVLG